MLNADIGPADGHGSQRAMSPAEQALRSRRLEDIGLLATRAAHDLNNMLTPMMIAMPILRPTIADPVALGLLDSLEKTVGRATGLVRQILDYAQGAGSQYQSVLVRQLMEEVTNFARETFPRNIRVEMQVSSDLWTVDANLSHLNQVLLRLCVNACNAMPKGGLLVLRAENCFLDGQAAASIEGARAGTYVRLLVEDSGNGSPPAMVARMNEPLIPAALAGDGTGLGLSTIREVIKEIKGFVRLSSAVDNGSLVQIYLPAQEPRLEDPNPAVFQPGKPLVQAPA